MQSWKIVGPLVLVVVTLLPAPADAQRRGRSVGGGSRAVPRGVGSRVVVAAPFRSVSRPYYAFRPRVSVGFGLYVGYPVAFPYYGYAYGNPYRYGNPYGYGYPYPLPIPIRPTPPIRIRPPTRVRPTRIRTTGRPRLRRPPIRTIRRRRRRLRARSAWRPALRSGRPGGVSFEITPGKRAGVRGRPVCRSGERLLANGAAADAGAGTSSHRDPTGRISDDDVRHRGDAGSGRPVSGHDATLSVAPGRQRDLCRHATHPKEQGMRCGRRCIPSRAHASVVVMRSCHGVRRPHSCSRVSRGLLPREDADHVVRRAAGRPADSRSNDDGDGVGRPEESADRPDARRLAALQRNPLGIPPLRQHAG